MKNSSYTGGGDMLDTKEFRKRMVHAAFNGEETDYGEICRSRQNGAAFWFFCALFAAIFSFIIPTIIILTEGIEAIGSWTPNVIAGIAMVIFSVLAYFDEKFTKKCIKKRNTLLEHEYTLNQDEMDYLLWYRFNIVQTLYPVCVIELMLDHIDRHENIQHKFVNEINKLNLIVGEK